MPVSDVRFLKPGEAPLQRRRPLRWTSAIALCAVGLLLAAGSAGAASGSGSLLFPFVTTEAGKFTFVTISNDGAGGFGGPASFRGRLLFNYSMKPVPLVNRAGCEHFDSVVGTTDLDMMIFEVNAKVTAPTGATALFEPGVDAPPTSGPAALPLADRVGFLIVQQFGAPTNAAFFGTAAVVDAAAGLVWSYTTTSSSSSAGNFSAVDGGKYSGPAPVGPGGVGASGFKNATWYPTNVASTSWLVLPLGDSAAMGGGDGIRLALRPASDHLPSPGLLGAYDLDEHFFSGGNQALVHCIGLLTRNDILLSGAALATAGGGFTFVAGSGDAVTVPVTDLQDPGGVYTASPFSLFKLATTTFLGAPMATMHREPDHDPCFNPDGVFPVVGVCAGY